MPLPDVYTIFGTEIDQIICFIKLIMLEVAHYDLPESILDYWWVSLKTNTVFKTQ